VFLSLHILQKCLILLKEALKMSIKRQLKRPKELMFLHTRETKSLKKDTLETKKIGKFFKTIW
jgi:hypothetical protein